MQAGKKRALIVARQLPFYFEEPLPIERNMAPEKVFGRGQHLLIIMDSIIIMKIKLICGSNYDSSGD